MNATTKLSAKGQVVIPKDVRDALGLEPGQTLEIIPTGGGVLLRAAKDSGSRSFDEVTAAIRARVKYKGPPVSLDEMKQAIDDMWASGGPNWDP